MLTADRGWRESHNPEWPAGKQPFSAEAREMDRPLRLYAPLGTLDLWIELIYRNDSKSLTYVFGD